MEQPPLVHTPVLDLDVDTVVVTVTGADRRGVTSRIFESVVAYADEVLDVEQLVVRGRLVLSVLLTADDPDALERAVRSAVAELDMQVSVERGHGDNRPRRIGRTHVTVIGAPLAPEAMAALTGRIRDEGANIDRIHRMARYPVTAIDLDVSGSDPDALRVALATEAARQQVDVAVRPSGIHRHAQRLVVMDVDSTLVQGEVIEMLAEHAGCADEVREVTEAAMRGELDFEQSLRERVRRLAGVPATALDQVYADLAYTPGARTMIRTLKRLGYRFALVSGGFTQVIAHIADELGIDYYAANDLEIRDGVLTGEVVGRIVDRPGKADALREFAREARIDVANTVAVGDGANDLDMLAAAGLGVAFNAKPMVRAAADTSVSVPYLDAVIYLLGITREEVEAADAAP